ncbi:MAG TPA: hypothetical protein EYG80_06320 [Flavobacteriaceae bacterium]|nr:hypothetical protein [Flavobacteriaceae bacterium]
MKEDFVESNKLTDDKKIELLKYNISRFDHYYASVNFKSSFLVVGNITILGFLMNNEVHSILFCILLTSITFSLICVLLAIKPYLKPYQGSNSILFFNDIANNVAIFKNKIRTLSNSEYILDLEEQNFILAEGLKNKFSYLNKATIIFIINIIIFFLIILTSGVK